MYVFIFALKKQERQDKSKLIKMIFKRGGEYWVEDNFDLPYVIDVHFKKIHFLKCKKHLKRG